MPTKSLGPVTALPEVTSAVLSDPSGTLHEASGDVDGEGTSAVLAYAARSLAHAGDQLGIGSFQRASVAGPHAVCVVCPWSDAVLGAFIDPARPLAVFERKLDAALHA